MLIIGTNMAAIRAQNAMRLAEAQIARSMERISSGKRINSAADDPAGFAIATRMGADITGMGQAIRNAFDGISRIRTADSALGSVSQIVIRVRELALQSASGSYGDTDRAAIDTEARLLTVQIRETLERAEFNGAPLFALSAQGSGGGAPTGDPVAVQTGTAATDRVEIGGSAFDLAGLDALDLSTAAGASGALSVLDDFLLDVSSERARFGAMENGLEMRIDVANASVLNMQEAYGRIVDVDYSAEAINLARAQMILRASTAMLAQANNMTRELVAMILRF